MNRPEAITAGEGLDLGFGPRPADFDFGGNGEADAAQAGNFGGVAFCGAGHQQLGANAEGVILPDAKQRVDEYGLTVGAGAVEEKQDVLFGIAGKAIISQALKVIL